MWEDCGIGERARARARESLTLYAGLECDEAVLSCRGCALCGYRALKVLGSRVVVDGLSWNVACEISKQKRRNTPVNTKNKVKENIVARNVCIVDTGK